MEMRIEAGDAVKLVEGSLRALRERLEFRLWQIPETQLDGSQFVKDHVDRSRETPPCRAIAGAFQELLPRILGGITPVVNSEVSKCKRSEAMRNGENTQQSNSNFAAEAAVQVWVSRCEVVSSRRAMTIFVSNPRMA